MSVGLPSFKQVFNARSSDSSVSRDTSTARRTSENWIDRIESKAWTCVGPEWGDFSLDMAEAPEGLCPIQRKQFKSIPMVRFVAPSFPFLFESTSCNEIPASSHKVVGTRVLGGGDFVMCLSDVGAPMSLSQTKKRKRSPC